MIMLDFGKQESDRLFFISVVVVVFGRLSGIFLMLMFATPSVKDILDEYQERKIIHKCAFESMMSIHMLINFGINLRIYVFFV